MPGESHKDCYGKMFPDSLHLRHGRPMTGKVFRYQITRAGGTFVSDRSVAVDVEEWDRCLKCPEFDPCYRLSMGKLALQTAISNG